MSAATPSFPRRHPDLRVRFDAQGELLLELEKRSAPASFDLLELLRRCDGARDLTALAACLERPGLSAGAALALTRTLLARLDELGFLAGTRPRSSGYFTGYAHPAIHRTMLQDETRTEAFKAAIDALAPGKTVLDVGAGSGVLSLFAARAGAAAVHAVEASALADVLDASAAKNGLAVTVHRGDAREVPRELAADVLVSEWLGHLVVTEAMWPAVAAARDRCLVPGGAMIPSRVRAFLAPFEDEALRADGPAYWATNPHGLDLSALAQVELDRPTSRIAYVPQEGVLAAPRQILDLDCATAGPDAARIEAVVEFEILGPGTIDGFGGWFRADLAPGVVLDTSPAELETHWRQHLFPVPPLPVETGERITARLDHVPAPGAPRRPLFRLRVERDGVTCFDGRYDDA